MSSPTAGGRPVTCDRSPAAHVGRAHLQEDALEQFEAGVALLRPAERRQRERVVRVLVLTGVHVLPESAQVRSGRTAGRRVQIATTSRHRARRGGFRGVHTGLAGFEMRLSHLRGPMPHR